MKDIGKAFGFVFEDPSWAFKFVIAACFMLLSVVGLGVFVLAGYFVQVTQRVMRRDPVLLPEWTDVGVKFIVGFKLIVVIMLYSLPAMIMLIPMFVLIGIAAVSGDPGAGSAVLLLYTGLYMLVVIPYSLALMAAMPIIVYRFALNERIMDALEVSAIWNSFKNHWQSSLVVAVIAAGLQSFAGIGIIFFLVGIFFTIFYAYLVSAYLSGALYLEHVQEGIVV